MINKKCCIFLFFTIISINERNLSIWSRSQCKPHANSQQTPWNPYWAAISHFPMGSPSKGFLLHIYLTTSSNQRLWECVRCRINVYPDTLTLAGSQPLKTNLFFTNNRGFTERCFSDKVHASLMIEDCVAWRRQFPQTHKSNRTEKITSAFKFRAKYCHIDL